MNNYKCINTKNYKLTLDKEYTPINIEDNYIHLINDENNEVKYSIELFEEILEVAPILKTKQEVIDSITYNHDYKTIVFNDLDNNDITIKIPLENTVSNISYGITEIFEIKPLIVRICEKTQDSELRKKLLEKAVLSYLSAIYKIDEIKYAIAIMSTNIKLEELGVPNEIVEYLDTFCDFSTNTMLNPNSDNDIKMWGFYYQNI